MELVARLRWGRTAVAVAAALERVAGPALVVGAPGLARVLARRGVAAFAVSARADDLPVADGALGALVVVGGSGEPSGRALRPGGALVLVAARPATDQSRLVLCAGLVDLEQRRAGRLVVTSGRAPLGDAPSARAGAG
jgi:hypothetical protein